MRSVSVRVYGPLNDFLPSTRRQRSLDVPTRGASSVKDLVESLGVPHPEIDLLVVNGLPVRFGHLVRNGDRVAAYPRFQRLDPGSDARLAPADQAPPRFVADVHLGRLAAYLRLAGFDVAYRPDYADHEVAAISASEDRTVLTRDVGLLKHACIVRGSFVRETEPARQLIEILRRYDLIDHAAPFTRCLRCNRLLDVTPKEAVEHRLPGRTRERFDRFSTCPGCQRVYWAGSHFERLRAFLDAAVAVARSPHAS